jgi:hypothetical protein
MLNSVPPEHSHIHAVLLNSGLLGPDPVDIKRLCLSFIIALNLM